MSSKANELAARLKRFATRIVKFARALQRDPSSDVIAKQLTGSGTAESANYHAARRGRSRDEFIAKLGVAAEEADETEHWLEVLSAALPASDAGTIGELRDLLREARELRAIFVGAAACAGVAAALALALLSRGTRHAAPRHV